MTLTLNSTIQWLSITMIGNVHPPNKVSLHVTKGEILKVFIKELPEHYPKRDARRVA